jgi:hypothetical protein
MRALRSAPSGLVFFLLTLTYIDVGKAQQHFFKGWRRNAGQGPRGFYALLPIDRRELVNPGLKRIWCNGLSHPPGICF